MPESNSANPMSAPNAGENNPNAGAEQDKRSQSHGEFNKAVEAELSKAAGIFAMAQKAEYAVRLQTARIQPAFVEALVNKVIACGKKSQAAVQCDHAAQEATHKQSIAERDLMASLRAIQSAARQKHLPHNPAALENYHVGETLNATQPLLERNSQSLIDQANTERPGAINTDFINVTQDKRAEFVTEGKMQESEESRAALERAQRNELLVEIIDGRKTIQYAANTLWPPERPENVQARKDFKLPLNRPYSY
jgi:hypothetical protein